MIAGMCAQLCNGHANFADLHADAKYGSCDHDHYTTYMQPYCVLFVIHKVSIKLGLTAMSINKKIQLLGHDVLRLYNTLGVNLRIIQISSAQCLLVASSP